MNGFRVIEALRLHQDPDQTIATFACLDGTDKPWKPHTRFWNSRGLRICDARLCMRDSYTMHAPQRLCIAPSASAWPTIYTALLTHLEVVLPILILSVQDKLALCEGSLRPLIDLQAQPLVRLLACTGSACESRPRRCPKAQSYHTSGHTIASSAASRV